MGQLGGDSQSATGSRGIVIFENQNKRAATFRDLHHRDEVLVLANAWDVISACIYEEEGFSALGTTSAGIAAVCGFPDGQRIDLQQMIAAVGRIAAAVEIPVSADIEAGYAVPPECVAKAAREAIKAGAVGINIEDGTGDTHTPLFDVDDQCKKIRAIREMAVESDADLFINARTDVFLVDGSEIDLDQAITRAGEYISAGADGIFLPDMGTLTSKHIRTLVSSIDAPVNIIAGSLTPSIPELTEIGVARLSFGPRPMRAALAKVRAMAQEWINQGTYSQTLAESLSYGEVNQLLEPRRTVSDEPAY